MEKIEVQTDNNCLAGSGGKEETQGALGGRSGSAGCPEGAMLGLPCRMVLQGHITMESSRPPGAPRNHFLDHPHRCCLVSTYMCYALHVRIPVQ